MKQKISLFLYIGLTLLISCHEDEPIDTTKPVVSIISPVENETAWNTTTITFDITEDVAIKKAEVFLGPDLIAEISSEPFKVALDTRKYSAGKYILKIIAYDHAGNKSDEAKVEFYINNNLLDFDRENFKPSDDPMFIFITDHNNEIVATASTADATSIPRPENFNDSTFAVHTVQSFFGTFNHLNSDFGVTPGIYTLGRRGFSEIGYATLEFTNVPTPSTYLLSVADNFGPSGPFMEDQYYYVNLYDNSDEAYLFVHSDLGNGYIFMDSLTADHYTFDLNNALNYDMALHNISLPSSDYKLKSLAVLGQQGDSGYTPSRFMYNKAWSSAENVQEYDFPLPENLDLFSRYIMVTYAYSPDDSKEYFDAVLGELGTNFKLIDADLEVQDFNINKPIFKPSGSYDFVNAFWFGGDEQRYTWTVTSKNGNDIHFPKISAEVLSIYPWLKAENFTSGATPIQRCYLYEFDEFENYDDYIEHVFGREDTKEAPGNYRAIYSTNISNTTNGRTSQLPLDVQNFIFKFEHKDLMF